MRNGGACPCSCGLVPGQPIEQRIDALPGCRQPRFQGVALCADRAQLLHCQAMGSLQLLVAQQQPLHALGQFLDRCHVFPSLLPCLSIVEVAFLRPYTCCVGARAGVHAGTVKREAGR
jgi:hypothetical protein